MYVVYHNICCIVTTVLNMFPMISLPQHIFQEGGQQIQLPSIMSHRLVGIMDVFRQLESYITLDTSRIFNVILLQHTQVLIVCFITFLNLKFSVIVN